MSEPSVKEVEVNGVRLHYVEEGSGEPMVFAAILRGQTMAGRRKKLQRRHPCEGSPEPVVVLQPGEVVLAQVRTDMVRANRKA